MCCDALGRPRSPRRVTKEFRHLRRSLGLRKVRLHDLRHGFARVDLTLGAHVKVVQEALGHSNVATTLRIYRHVIPGMQHEAAKQIDAALRTHLEHG